VAVTDIRLRHFHRRCFKCLPTSHNHAIYTNPRYCTPINSPPGLPFCFRRRSKIFHSKVGPCFAMHTLKLYNFPEISSDVGSPYHFRTYDLGFLLMHKTIVHYFLSVVGTFIIEASPPQGPLSKKILAHNGPLALESAFFLRRYGFTFSSSDVEPSISCLELMTRALAVYVRQFSFK
jgi:hypothetical protein